MRQERKQVSFGGWEMIVAQGAGGFAHGAISVIAAQPLDVLKTRRQALGGSEGSMQQFAQRTLAYVGVRGMYKGSLPLLVPSGFYRGLQFMAFQPAFQALKQVAPDAPKPLLAFVAGAAGGAARTVVETPFEYIKVRLQVDQPWLLKKVFEGGSATLQRNVPLFAFFTCFRELFAGSMPSGDFLGPFLTGGLSATCAWAVVYPLDRYKTHMQDGRHAHGSLAAYCRSTVREGGMRLLYAGAGFALLRSAVANSFGLVGLAVVERRVRLGLEARDV